MKKRVGVFIIVNCLLLSGCTGLKNIQDLTYIVAIGMDYDEEKKEFTVYLQGLNFANVAKQEGAKPVEPIPIFVASATGETLNLAVSKLFRKAEPPLFFGHVKALVLSQNLVNHRFKDVVEEMGRNRSIRHTLRVLTTEENIEDVFNIKALFNYPAVYTVLYKKNDRELYQDEIKPITLMRFFREYYEPMGVAKLPSIKIDPDSWKADKNYSVLFIDGFVIFQNRKFTKKIPFKDAVFMDWLMEKNNTIDHRVEEDGKLVAAVRLSSPDMKIKYEEGTEKPRFSIELSVQADLLEKVDQISLDNLKKSIEIDLKNKLISTYRDGIEQKADLLNIGDKWYREHPQKFKELEDSGEFYLEDQSLTSTKVKVQIFHFNTYQYNKR